MQKKASVPGWAWAYYQDCQETAAETSDEAEEQKLTFLVKIFCQGKVPTTLEKLEKLVDNHLAGNRQKARRRERLLEKCALFGDDRKTDERLLSCDSLETVRQSVTPGNWRLLSGLAVGYDYQELSRCFGIPVGTLKSTVSRVRSRYQDLAA